MLCSNHWRTTADCNMGEEEQGGEQGNWRESVGLRNDFGVRRGMDGGLQVMVVVMVVVTNGEDVRL